MKIIFGLGNPGKKYEKTRHNVGFMIADRLQTTDYSQFVLNKKFNAGIAQGEISDEKILLVKPQTSMNNSGQAVKAISLYYKINPRDIWVVSDDIDLPLGQIRIRFKGSSGGHKGLQSIIDHLGTQKFPRIRIGIRNSLSRAKSREELGISKVPAEEYVLQKFSKKEIDIIDEIIEKAIEEIKNALKNGIEEKTININSN